MDQGLTAGVGRPGAEVPGAAGPLWGRPMQCGPVRVQWTSAPCTLVHPAQGTGETRVGKTSRKHAVMAALLDSRR